MDDDAVSQAGSEGMRPVTSQFPSPSSKSMSLGKTLSHALAGEEREENVFQIYPQGLGYHEPIPNAAVASPGRVFIKAPMPTQRHPKSWEHSATRLTSFILLPSPMALCACCHQDLIRRNWKLQQSVEAHSGLEYK